jgi:hypothetical protein
VRVPRVALKAVARAGGIIPSEKLTVAAIGRYNSGGDRVLLDHARRAGPSEDPNCGVQNSPEDLVIPGPILYIVWLFGELGRSAA